MNYWPRQVVMGSTNDHRVAGSNPGSSRLHVEVMVKSNQCVALVVEQNDAQLEVLFPSHTITHFFFKAEYKMEKIDT